MPLMHVNGDQSLEFRPLHFLEVFRRLRDERVEDVKKFVVRFLENTNMYKL